MAIMFRHGARAFIAKSTVLGLLTVVSVPATANAGFFDDLFGGLRQAPVQAPQYEQPSSALPDDVSPRELRQTRKTVEDEKPVLQKTTDLWHDKTLRYGDAVMMTDGLHVYSGPEALRHSAAEFTRLDVMRNVSPKARLALIAMDTTRNDPLTSGAASDTVASGRSAAVASSIVAGYKITDAKGRSVRYVGP